MPHFADTFPASVQTKPDALVENFWLQSARASATTSKPIPTAPLDRVPAAERGWGVVRETRTVPHLNVAIDCESGVVRAGQWPVPELPLLLRALTEAPRTWLELRATWRRACGTPIPTGTTTPTGHANCLFDRLHQISPSQSPNPTAQGPRPNPQDPTEESAIAQAACLRIDLVRRRLFLPAEVLSLASYSSPAHPGLEPHLLDSLRDTWTTTHANDASRFQLANGLTQPNRTEVATTHETPLGTQGTGLPVPPHAGPPHAGPPHAGPQQTGTVPSPSSTIPAALIRSGSSGNATQSCSDLPAPRLWPNAGRDTLWGHAFTDWIASEVLSWREPQPTPLPGAKSPNPERFRIAAASQTTSHSSDRNVQRRCVSELHRRWLTEPREELGGNIPLDCLRYGRNWVADRIAQHADDILRGNPLMPIPATLAARPEAPIGLHEMVMYFDACRHLLRTAWRLRHGPTPQGPYQSDPLALATRLRAELLVWLLSVNQDGEIPAEVIRDERLRIPQGSGREHFQNGCPCPICSEPLTTIDTMLGPTRLPAGTRFVVESVTDLITSHEPPSLPPEPDAEPGNAVETKDALESKGDTPAPSRLSPRIPSPRIPSPRIPSALIPDHREVTAKSSATSRIRLPWFVEVAVHVTPWRQPICEPLATDRFSTLALGYRVAAIISVLEDARGNQPDIEALAGAYAAYQAAGDEDRRLATHKLHYLLQRLRISHPQIDADAMTLQKRLIERLTL